MKRLQYSPYRHLSECGYTLVELLVALAVSSIVIAGTYAGYTFFAQQHQVLTAQTEVNRNALRAIDLLKADIRMAGYLDYSDVNPMPSNQPITISNGNDLIVVYDDFDDQGVLYRALIRYYLNSYTPASGIQRQRLMREWRKCNNPSALCALASSTPLYGQTGGEPILDWVTAFSVEAANLKSSGTFSGQPQTVKATLTIQSPQKIDGSSKVVSKTFNVITRAKNVSLVP
jgi:prepilin-type N-terminal cleavage/methylation domain-containing protein